MIGRIWHIGFNTYREAVRDRVLYNLVIFALLLLASAPLFGQISIGVEQIVMINLGLAAITIFGVVIAIFIGIGLVSKEIEKKTLYTVLARPVRRWEFIVGKYFGLTGTLVVNTAFMTIGFYLALMYVGRGLTRGDVYALGAIYLIVLEFFMVTAIALLFSTFTTPLFSALFAFAMFVIGSFAGDIRGFAAMTSGLQKALIIGISYLLPNFGAFNVASQIAHQQPVGANILLADTGYALVYSAAALSTAILVFQRRNLK